MAKKTKGTVEKASEAAKAAGKKKAVEEPPEQPSAGKAAGIAPGKRVKDEIDDIFSSKPAAKKAATQKTADGDAAAAAAPSGEDGAALTKLAEQVKEARNKQQGKKPKVEGSKDDIFGESSAKARKKTEEGFVIYTEDELGLGKKGGDTDLCPFDCDCCY